MTCVERRWFSVLVSCWLLSASVWEAQPAGDAYGEALEIESARIRLADAKARFERARVLHEQEVISKEQLREEETRFLLARVELDKTYLDVFRRRPRIMIEKAVKYQTDDGRKRVRLRLTNAGAAPAGLSAEGLDLAEMARLAGAADIVISLKTASGYREGILLESTIVSDPYETRIPMMKSGESAEIDVGLLVEDVEEVVVSIDHAGGLEQKQILLHKDSGTRPVSLSASQTSLVADLGGEAVYELKVERFTSGAETFELEAAGLPAGVSVELADPESETRLRQVYFSQDVTTRYLELKTKLPERPTEDVEPDRALHFSVAVGGETLVLELVPRGVGKLEVDAVNLYHEIARSEVVRLEVTARNAGSLRLARVVVGNDVPYRWRLATEPASFPSLGPGEEKALEVALEPPGDVALGEYEVRIWLEGTGSSRPVKSEPKVVRVHVRAEAKFFGKAALLALLLLVLFSMVFYGIRFSRR